MGSWCGRMILWSAKNGYEEVLGFLFKKRVQVKDLFEDIEGWSALQVAVREGHIKAVEKLLDVGADVNATTIYGTALYAAAQEGHIEIVEKLLDVSVDVNATNTLSTPIQVARLGDHLEIVQLLLDAGAVDNA